MPNSGENKRRYERLDLAVEVDPKAGGHSFVKDFFSGKVMSENISEGGIFLCVAGSCVNPEELMGKVVEFDFNIPDGKGPITAVGRVNWWREYQEESADKPELMPGLGLEFVEIDKKDRVRIQIYVRKFGAGETAY